jgi:hypothetical protein
MDTHDYGRKVWLLLAVGAIVTILVGVVAGYGNKHSAVPWKVQHSNTTHSELSLGIQGQKLGKSPKSTESEWTIVKSTINPGG